MDVKELTAKEFLAHLYRHPMPEIMDDVCLAALANVEAQYGDTVTHGAGLEVRLSEEARYVDYIMNIDTDEIPGVETLWHEIDYAEFRKDAATGEKISPCLFANTAAAASGNAAYWDALLPPFLGEARAKNLRPALNLVMEALPQGAYIKQIGTMTSRGELDIMRLVIMFPVWEMVPPGLAAIGWQGDGAALDDAMAPWKETKNIAVNIDLGVSGVLPKIGIEVFSRWRHPLLVDKFLARLEDAGLCLPSKGEALRRWIRIRPDGDPFIQTLIAYFKLNYKDGQITEAKAYLEQSPYIHHHYFDAYERPAYVEICLKDEKNTLPVGEALKRLGECEKKNIRRVRFLGDAAGYEHLDRLLAECKSGAISATLVLPAKKIPDSRWEEIFALDPEDYIVELGADGSPTENIRAISRAGLGSRTAVRWTMIRENAGWLSDVVKGLNPFGFRELVISGGTPLLEPLRASALSGSYMHGKREALYRSAHFPAREQMEKAAQFIEKYEKEREDGKSAAGMKLIVDSCFSPLRALMGGADPAKNGNRGIRRGCTAGRDHFCVLASGLVAPCQYLDMAEAADSLVAYWEQSPRLAALRAKDRPDGARCTGCRYVRRCLPCPMAGGETRAQSLCPLNA